MIILVLYVSDIIIMGTKMIISIWSIAAKTPDKF